MNELNGRERALLFGTANSSHGHKTQEEGRTELRPHIVKSLVLQLYYLRHILERTIIIFIVRCFSYIRF